MKALVLGASGHIGQGVTRELLSAGCDVTATSRRANPPHLRDLPVEVVVGDLSQPGTIAALGSGHDVVVDAAAPKPLGYFVPPRGGPDPIRRARVRSMELVRMVEDTGATLVHVGSFSTLPRPGGYEVAARWRRERNVYFHTKAAMERPLLDAGQRGLPVAIVNPSGVFGPWETCPIEESVVARVLTGQLPVVMRHMVNAIDVRDLASAIRALIELGRFGVPTPLSAHDIHLDDLVKWIADLAGVARPTTIDPRFALAAGTWIEAVAALAGRHAPTAVCAAPVVADSWAMGTSNHLRALGVEPRPLEETVVDAVRWRQELLGLS